MEANAEKVIVRLIANSGSASQVTQLCRDYYNFVTMA